MKKQVWVGALLAISVLFATACGGGSSSSGGGNSASPAASSSGGSSGGAKEQPKGTVTVWWNKGYYEAEDNALKKVVADFEKESGYKVELSFYTTEDAPKKTVAAIEAGNPPDVSFTHLADFQYASKFAWQSKLADITDVIEPVKSTFTDGALKGALLYNAQTKKRAYYAAPIEQQALHIFYRKDVLQKVGKSAQDFPTKWDEYWDFWKKVHDDLKAKGEKSFGMGITMGTSGSDNYFNFEQFLEAFGGKVLDDDGKVIADQPENKQAIVSLLKWHKDVFKYNPDSVINWLDVDNNNNILNATVAMTPNASLSIPATKLGESDFYLEKLGTAVLPDKPDGSPMVRLVAVKVAVVPAQAKNIAGAKAFLKYLLKPERLADYIKGGQGRWFPVMPELMKDPFWTDPKDPHRSVALNEFTKRPTRPFYFVNHPAYNQVLSDQVWGKAVGKVVLKGVSPEQAADEAIADIKQKFADWK